MAGLFDLLGQAVNQRLGVDRNDFIDNELPRIAQSFKNAQSKEEIESSLHDLTRAGMKSGIGMEGIQKLSEMLIGPAAERLRTGELDRIRGDYGPQTTPITPMVAPEGQGQPLPANTSFTPQTTPGRPLDEPGRLRLGQALGANAVGYNTLLGGPSEIAARESLAKSRDTTANKVQQELEVNRQKERELQGLSDQPLPGSAFSPRNLGRFGGMGTVAAQQTNPLNASRQGLIEAQTGAANAAAAAHGRANSPRDRTTAEFQDYSALLPPGQQPTLEDFMAYKERARSSQTVTEAPVKPEEKLLADRTFARAAVDRGIDKMAKGPERDAALQKLADEMDLELTGSPEIKVPDNTRLFGLMDKPKSQQEPVTFSGASLKRKPKTVTRGRPGEQPAPQGGAPAAPKPGAVVRGYRFKGGDPSQQTNWEQVR